MGLEPAKRIFYINVNQPLPDTGQLPERFEPATPAPAERESDGKSFWSRLLEHLPF
jgi:hypothetical protein